ncbi:MAG: cysteine hydrolase [Spirochaetaceae bacterium]|nr:cysteine hydrolase [Spirochaetaceae bacterium]
MKNALIIIDYIYDFVADDGKLTCGKPAQEIDGFIAAQIEKTVKAGDFIVIASDSHEKNDVFSPEHKLFPPHCIAHTPGRELFGATGESIRNAPGDLLLHIDKTRYSAFAGTPLDLKLRERGTTNLYLAGVCSDICVLHTAVDAYNLGYKIHVYEKGVASFNAEGHKFALSHFKNTLGAEIV